MQLDRSAPRSTKALFALASICCSLTLLEGRVTAQLKRCGLGNSFGTDYVKHKQAAAQTVLADLSTKQGADLLFQWLSNEYVVGLHIAPPCGSASRVRSIRLKRKHGGSLPNPLRSDHSPNGLIGLPFTDRIKISQANNLTARLVEWACDVGVIFCMENRQFSHFCVISGIFWISQFFTHVNMEASDSRGLCWHSTPRSSEVFVNYVPAFLENTDMRNGVLTRLRINLQLRSRLHIQHFWRKKSLRSLLLRCTKEALAWLQIHYSLFNQRMKIICQHCGQKRVCSLDHPSCHP